MSEPILTFSGTHPFRRQHAGVRGSRAAELVAEERCPRCEDDLYPEVREAPVMVARKGDPHPIWRPAGSRATACRCIPVCEVCAFAESMGPVAQDLLIEDVSFEPEEGSDPGRQVRMLGALEYVWKTANAALVNWPVDRERMVLGCAVIQASDALKRYRLDDELPSDTKANPHPGGWADPDN